MADDVKGARARARELDDADGETRRVLAMVAEASGYLDSAHGCLRLVVGGIPTTTAKDHGTGAMLAHARYLAREALAAMVPLFSRDGGEAIAHERRRQIIEEGYASAHDDRYRSGELILAAACYALAAGDFAEATAPRWPWPADYDKRPAPGADVDTKVRALEKAGALLAAEIDRLRRTQVPAEAAP